MNGDTGRMCAGETYLMLFSIEYLKKEINENTYFPSRKVIVNTPFLYMSKNKNVLRETCLDSTDYLFLPFLF